MAPNDVPDPLALPHTCLHNWRCKVAGMQDAPSLVGGLVSLPLRIRSRTIRALPPLPEGLLLLTGSTLATAMWRNLLTSVDLSLPTPQHASWRTLEGREVNRRSPYG